MNFKRYFLSVMLTVAVTISAIAASGREATLSAQSESGKVKLNVKILGGDIRVSSAELTTEQGTVDLMGAYDASTVVDMPNHIMTICFQEKGKPADAPDTRMLKVWSTPSSFVKSAGGEFNWRFKLKVGGNVLKEVTVLSGIYEWNP
jgi:hypothetical protein